MKLLQVIFFVFCLIVPNLAETTDNSTDQCNEDTIVKIDNLVSGILPFNKPKVPPPEKFEDIPEFCFHYGNVLSTIEDINRKCMQDTYRNIINLVIYNIKRNTRSICSKKAIQSKKLTVAKKNFLRISRCINSGSKKIEKCARLSKAHMVAIQNADSKKKIPLLCCEFHTIRKCIVAALSQEPGCGGQENLGLMQKMVESLGVNALNMACGDYDTEQKCRTLSLPKRKKSQKIPKSYLIPVVNILEGL